MSILQIKIWLNFLETVMFLIYRHDTWLFFVTKSTVRIVVVWYPRCRTSLYTHTHTLCLPLTHTHTLFDRYLMFPLNRAIGCQKPIHNPHQILSSSQSLLHATLNAIIYTKKKLFSFIYLYLSHRGSEDRGQMWTRDFRRIYNVFFF